MDQKSELKGSEVHPAPDLAPDPATAILEPGSEVSTPSEQEFKPSLQFWLAFAPIAVLAMMVSLDGTSVSVALPIMADSLHGTTIEAFWTGTSFLLSSAVFQLPIGALSEIFGRMYSVCTCIVFFLVGIIISGAANDLTTMLLGRTLQGVGGGGLILLSDIVITDLVPMRQRGAYFGLIAGVWAFGSVIGPVVGGALAYKASWRWIFWINIPFAVISLVMVPIYLRLKRTPGSILEKLKRVDWFGSVLFVGATTCFLIPLTWGGVQYAWDSWRTVFPLVLGIAAIFAFCIYENLLPREPIIRLELLKEYNMAFSLVAGAVNSAIVYGLLYFAPLYFEATKGYNPIITGIALFPSTFTIAPMSILSGVIITRTGDFRIVARAGWTIATLGLGVMVLLDVDTSLVKWLFITLTTGIGLGLLYTTLAIINQAATTDENVAFAISLFFFSRCLGQCFGVAISGTIFQNEMKRNLLSTSTLADRAIEYSRDSSRIVAILRDMPEDQAKVDLVQAYADSLKIVWAVYCALSGVLMIGSFFIKYVSLDRKHQTKQGLQNGEKASGE